MSIVNVEPLIHGELLSTKIYIKVPDFNGNYTKNNVLKVLLNCGWSLDFDKDKLELYKRHIDDIDIILITDGDFIHSGALLWLFTKFLEQKTLESCPKVLCTEGTYKFIRACLIDVLENVTFTDNFEYYNADNLEFFNTNCVKLRYRETYCFVKKLDGFEVKTSFCALNNGYSVGGAVWVLSAGFNTVVCGDKIRIYPSTLLNGINVDDFMRPDLLLLSHEELELPQHVSDPQGVEVSNDLDSLVDKLVTTLTSGGNVLFPMDVDYSLINLLIHLNMVWSTSQLSQFRIVLASPIADKLLLFIGTCLEYMKTSIFHNFIKTLWNPLMEMTHVDIITSLTQLSKYRYRPTVFISTTSSVDFGFSNFLFLAISSYYKNLVVLTKPNKSVSKYILNPSLHKTRPPLYKLQVNLNYNKSQQDEPKSDDENYKNKENESGYFQFSNLGNIKGFSDVQTGTIQKELEIKNTEDYGLPFTDFMADPSNPYGYSNLPRYEEVFEEQYYVEEVDEKSHVDDYYRKYIDDTKNDLFDIETESTQESGPKTDLLTRKFPFFVKSQVLLVKCFSNILNQPQIPSLLYRTLPRNVVLIPNSMNCSKNELYLSKLLKCNLHSFFNNKVKTKLQTKNEQFENKLNTLISVDLNLTNYPVLLDLQLLSSVRNFFNKKPPPELPKAKSKNYEGIDIVMNTVEMWKYNNNKEQTCQIVAKLTSTSTNNDTDTNQKMLHCHTFWSDESSKNSKLEFTLEDIENQDLNLKKDVVKMGVDSTLFVGDLSMSSYAKFVDDCLPNSVSMVSGSVMINNKVKVSKNQNINNNEWIVEGTLDPSYYLSRKLFKKLHNKIEPIY